MDRRRPRPAHVPRAHAPAPPVRHRGQRACARGPDGVDRDRRRCGATSSTCSSTATTSPLRARSQYARSLNPTELRAVHFDIDPLVTRELEATWAEVGPRNLTLEVIECPDRRIERAALELAAEAARPLDTECTIVLPRRSFPTRLERLLHDRTADCDRRGGHARAPGVRDRHPVPSRRRQAPPLPRALAAQATVPQRRRATRRCSRPTSCSRSAPRDATRGVRRDVARALEVLRSDPIGERAQGRRHADARVHAHGRLAARCSSSSRAAARSRASSEARASWSRGPSGSWQRKLAIINPDYELVAGPESDQLSRPCLAIGVPASLSTP